MKVLVTGGAGYIGSTICSALEDSGHTPVILDTLEVGPRAFTRGRIFYQADIADEEALETIFTEHPDIYATIHCAAYIIAPVSVSMPFEYYNNNVGKSILLFHNLNKMGCKRIVFSSSASIYDMVPEFIVREDSPIKPISPYAHSKIMIEQVLEDFCLAYGMQGMSLRYFNPIGADPKLRSGAHQQEATQVLNKLIEASNSDSVFQITGTDFPTRDGTCVRDYIHIWDLARAHVMAVEGFEQAFEKYNQPEQRHLVINLGTGRGVTVRELVNAFESVLGREINKVDAPRRPGEAIGAYANADRAKALLGWEMQFSTEQAIADALRWYEYRDQLLG